MPVTTTKLTLSIRKSLIDEAKRVALRRRTSVSAMFTEFLKSLTLADNKMKPSIGPVTRNASGLARLPDGVSDAQLVEDALSAKFKS